jgi:hypothetical protein
VLLRKVYAMSGVVEIVEYLHGIQDDVYLHGQIYDRESREWIVFLASPHCVVTVFQLSSVSPCRRASPNHGLIDVDARLALP